jgi:hypothetical protein
MIFELEKNGITGAHVHQIFTCLVCFTEIQ